MENKYSHYPKLIRDYIEIQLKYPNAVILTEVGSFFEIWELDDVKLGYAIKASQILDIALTRRDKSKPDSPRMAGFPSYTVDNYVKKLVDAGETVVVVKQSVNGKKSDQNKDVKRTVDRIVSPATIISNSNNKPHYFGACYVDGSYVGLSFIDISTGEVRISEMSLELGKEFIEKINPIEMLFCQNVIVERQEKQIFHAPKDVIIKQSSAGKVFGHIYDESNPSSNHSLILEKIGIDLWPLGSLALANLLNFLVEYNPLLLKKISKPKLDKIDENLFLSKNANFSLDLFESPVAKDQTKTLLYCLDQCKTSMGKRSLGAIIQAPLSNLDKINERLDLVSKFIDKKEFLEDLKQVYDIPRLTRRMVLNNLMPHEIINFYNSLKISNKISKDFSKENAEVSKLTKFIEKNIDLVSLEAKGNQDFEFLIGKSEVSILNEKTEWKNENKKLLKRTDILSRLIDTDKLKIAERQESIQLVGPKGLASKCNKEKIEVKIKASELQILDEEWNNIANKEFYLKRKYILAAEKAWNNFQQDIVEKFGEELLVFSEQIGDLDVLSNFAKLSLERNYSRPILKNEQNAFVNLKNMRHPIVELSKDLAETFTPNDISLDKNKNVKVIYGANSAGKSTVLKALALNIVMAQIGCYIPSDKGSELNIFDSIMTRMTTYDSISEGLSTFTMEMIELQNALKRREERSLFLFDEIGRGTSSEDGEAIAFSVLDYLSGENNKSITLFSTHYHSLYENIKGYKNVEVKHIHCEIKNNLLIFSRKLQDGPGSGSYGIIVAKSCGLPDQIIRLAQNYNKKNAQLKTSRYNSKIQGQLCEYCNEKPAQETHHLIEQFQGKVKKIVLNGIEKDIHDSGNLLMLCSSCHSDITKHKIKIEKKKAIGDGSIDYYLEIKTEK